MTKFSATSIFLSLLSISLLFKMAVCAEPLFHFCFSPDNYTTGGPYDTNLNALSKLLYAKAPPTGFGRGTVGKGPDSVNGLALCRGDVSKSNCGACVDEASKEVKSRCPTSKGAIIWYDNCLYKYSNDKFFGTVDEQNRFYLYNLQSVENPTSFNNETKEFLGRLAGNVNASPKLFATDEMERYGAKDEDSKKLYGLVQCTRDLSGADCEKCLTDAIGEIKSCCDGKRGGRVVGGSCNFRYELYPFVNKA